MTTTIPLQLRLDNAANIYPASLSKTYSSQYRMSVTLSESVDADCLQRALETVSERIPTFRCSLKRGAFWWYLRRQERLPHVLPLQDLRRFQFDRQGSFLYRVCVDRRRIVLDVFHALCDGTGAQVFLLTLTGEYLRLKYGISIDYKGKVLNPADTPVYAEVEDSFKTAFAGKTGELEQNDDAYHLKGRFLPREGLKDIRMVLPADVLHARCRKYGCTLTEFLTAAMLHALQEEHRSDPNPKKCPVLKVTVPVNLRPFYGSRTLRNFSSYVNLGVDVSDRYFSFRELAETVREQKQDALHWKNLEPKIAKNVQLEENLAVRCVPLFIKKPIIDLINRLHGDRFCTTTMSNMGKVDLPEQMQPYVEEVEFILGRQRGNSGAASCVGYNGKLFLHFTRHIASGSFEHRFLELLCGLGIPVETREETLA